MERGVSVKGRNASMKGFDRVDRVFFLLFSFFCIFYVCTLAVLPVNLAIYIKKLTKFAGSCVAFYRRSCQEQGEMFVSSAIRTR